MTNPLKLKAAVILELHQWSAIKAAMEVAMETAPLVSKELNIAELKETINKACTTAIEIDVEQEAT